MELNGAGSVVFVRQAQPTAADTAKSPAERNVKHSKPGNFGVDVCRCSPRCAGAGSDTPRGSHGCNCVRNYERERAVHYEQS